MTEQPTEVFHLRPDEPAADPDANGEEPTSYLAELRARRAELAGSRTFDLAVPGYRGKVGLRLGPISGRQQTQLVERLARSKAPEKDFNLNADYLIAALREVVGRQQDGDEWRPFWELAQLEPDTTVKLDKRLVELLQLEPAADSAREVLRALYALAPAPEVAITFAGGKYMQWAAAEDDTLDEEFAGES
jgi:hypothetical protein